MSVNADDLPDDVRARIGLGPRKRKRPRPSAGGMGEGRRGEEAVATRCGGCGVVFPMYRKAEQHADREHRGRAVRLTILEDGEAVAPERDDPV